MKSEREREREGAKSYERDLRFLDGVFELERDNWARQARVSGCSALKQFQRFTVKRGRNATVLLRRASLRRLYE